MSGERLRRSNKAEAATEAEVAAETKSLIASAEQGDADAIRTLFFMYAEGDGVPQDYKEAAKWLRKAAEQGYAEAQYDLGTMHQMGEGVPQDDVKAHAW